MLLHWVTVGLSLLFGSKDQNMVKTISSQQYLLEGPFFFLFHTSCDIKGWHMGCIVMVKSVSLGSLIDRSWHHSELTPPPQTWWLFDPQPFTAPHRNTSWSLIGRHEAWSYCRVHQCCFWLGLDLDWESRLFSCLEDLFASQDWRWRLQWIKVESSWTLPMLPR